MVAYFAFHLTHALGQQVTARQEADAMIRSAFDVLDAGIEIVEGRRVVWQNPRAAALFGVRTEGGWRCPGAAEDACGAGGACRAPRAVSPNARCEFELRTDGLDRIYEMLPFPVPSGLQTLVLYFDRTVEIQDQRRLMQTERLASLGRAVHGVAHELNTPLATIQTLSRDILEVINGLELPASARLDLDESAGIIVEEIQRCRRITHALLGRAEPIDTLPSAPTTVAAAVERAIAVVFPKACDTVEVRLGPLGAMHLALDPAVQIFVNLLQNARDANPGGTITVVGRASSPPRVEVLDDGPGVSAEAERHLFEPFFTTKPPGRGTGLGLYTSYALAKSLAGDLSLGNRRERGAVAAFILPPTKHQA
jgi:signal transduction histidine kinase